VDELARLVAIQDIRDVISRYALLFDDKNWDAFSELWADDAVWAVRDGMAFEGKEALMGFLSTCLPDDYSGKHMNSPPLVVVAEDGKTATAQTDVVWVSQDFENRILARYVDEFVKQRGRWVFKRRVEEPLPFIAGPPPMSDTAMEISQQTMAPS
jgi:ketosteroid isomerase-like protein